MTSTNIDGFVSAQQFIRRSQDDKFELLNLVEKYSSDTDFSVWLSEVLENEINLDQEKGIIVRVLELCGLYIVNQPVRGKVTGLFVDNYDIEEVFRGTKGLLMECLSSADLHVRQWAIDFLNSNNQFKTADFELKETNIIGYLSRVIDVEKQHFFITSHALKSLSHFLPNKDALEAVLVFAEKLNCYEFTDDYKKTWLPENYDIENLRLKETVANIFRLKISDLERDHMVKAVQILQAYHASIFDEHVPALTTIGITIEDLQEELAQ